MTKEQPQPQPTQTLQPMKVKPMDKLPTRPNGLTDPDIIIPMADLNNPLPPEKEVSKSNELQLVLMRTAADEVSVRLDQVVELIGEIKANEICIFYNSLLQAPHGRSRTNSVVAKSRRGNETGLGTFNRVVLLEAINEAQGKLEIQAQPDGKPNPDAERLAAAKKKAGVR